MTTTTATYLGEFDVGTQIRLVGTFRNLAGQLANPTAGTLTIRDDLGVETAVGFNSWVNDSVGVFHYDHTIGNNPGRYHVWWRATATLLVSERAYFEVPLPPVSTP